jgi:hypothetical protein
VFLAHLSYSGLDIRIPRARHAREQMVLQACSKASQHAVAKLVKRAQRIPRARHAQEQMVLQACSKASQHAVVKLVKLVKRARIFFYFRVRMRGTLSMRVNLTRNCRPPVIYPAQAPLYIYFTTFLLHVLLYCMLTHYYTLLHILYYCMLTRFTTRLPTSI